MSPAARCLALAILLGSVAAGSLRADDPPTSKPAVKGQHVLIIGNSFQVFVDHHLNVMAQAAGIQDHIRGGDPLAATRVDVVATNPWFKEHDKPDLGLETLVTKALKHNPQIRVLAQIGWLPYDDAIFPNPEKGHPPTDWNARSIADLRQIHAAYARNAADQVRAINDRLGRQVVCIVPTYQAVIALREKIAAGEAAGLKSPDDLFNDSIGHAKPPLELLNAYCHYAVIYGQSPIGLVVKDSKDEKLHRVLQEIAWKAVTSEPLSGVK